MQNRAREGQVSNFAANFDWRAEKIPPNGT